MHIPGGNGTLARKADETVYKQIHVAVLWVYDL
jgi:hypothetical protein